jgi:hypothetical protein
MKNIKIVFEHDKGFVERVIRWLTRSDVNHIAVVYDSTDWECPWVAEAAVKGVRTVPERSRRWKYSFNVKYDAIRDVQGAQQFIGQSYDFTGFFIFGWILLWWRLLKVRIRRPLHPTKGQFCSEFVAQVLLPKVYFEDPQWVTPQDILEVCRNHKELFEEVPSA